MESRGLSRMPVIPALLALAATGTVISQAAEVTFQYYRFTPTKNRGGDAENQTQVSEFEFFFRGGKIDHSAVVATGGVTHPNPGDAESAQKMVDGSRATKWFDNNKVPVTFNFGAPVAIDSYRFATANDALYRTPVRWTLHGSNDNVNFVLIDDRSGGDNATPTAYFTFRPLLVATPPAASGYPVFSTFHTTASVVDNSVAGQDVYQAYPSIVKNTGPETSLTWNVTNTPTGITLTPALPAPAINFADTRTITPIVPGAFTDYTLSATTAAGTAALTHKLRAVPGASATARYVRFTATATRENGQLVQMAEMEFFNGTTRIPVSTVTNPGGNTNNNANEDSAKINDGNYRTKWLNHNNCPLVFDFGSAQTFDGYQMTTGNDAAGRDPVRWLLETSSDGVTWTLLDNVYHYLPPSTRRAKSGIIPVGGIPAVEWTGSNDSTWDTSTPNWTAAGTTTPAVAYTEGTAVVFGETTGSRDIGLATPLAPDSLTFTNVATSDPYLISGAPITGSGDLFKKGSGELQLNSPNSLMGSIYLSGGKLVAGDFEALGTRDATARLEVSNGAELQVVTSLTSERRMRVGEGGGTVRVEGGQTFTKIGPVDLIGTLTKVGGGTLQFNGYQGGTSVAADDFIVNEGTLEFAAATGFFNSRPFGGTQFDDLKITVNAGATVRMSTDSALGGDYLAYQTSLAQIRLIGGTLDFNNGGFNYLHNGTVGGEGRVVLQGGSISGPGQLEPAGNTGNLATTLFTVLPSQESSYIGGSGALALNPGDSSVTLDVADGSAEDDLVVQRPVTGARPLIKTGAGNLNLTGSNTFSGAFTVSAGSLTLGNVVGNATGTSTVTMAAGTTLRGLGVTAGTISTAGAVAPGDSFAPTGTLTVGNATLTGTLQVDISQADSDKLVVNGTLDVSGATLAISGTLTEPLYQIVSTTGAITGPFVAHDVPAGYTLQYHSNSIVLLSNSAPAYQSWAASLSDPSPEADPDGDGLINLLEFILNSDAMVPGTADLPEVTTNPAGDLVFTFVRRSSSAYLGAVVEYSTDLSEGSWTTFGGTSVQTNTPGSGLDTVTATLPASLAAPGGKIFARLKVEVP